MIKLKQLKIPIKIPKNFDARDTTKKNKLENKILFGFNF